MKIKKGADYQGLKREMWFAIGVALSIINGYGYKFVLTCGTDSHTTGLHPKGFAVDIRTRHIPLATETLIYNDLQTRLEAMGFDVVYREPNRPRHLHIEYDSKPGEQFIEEVD